MLAKRITGNAAANIYAQVVTTIVQLSSVPLFLGFWSTERYGEWLLLFSVPGYLALADAGLSNTAANDAAIFVAQGDKAKARRSLHTACGLLAISGLIMISVLLVVVWLIPWSRWFNLRLVTNSQAIEVALILGVYTVLGFALSLYGAAYRVAYRLPRSIYFFNTLRLVELGALGVAVASSNSIVFLSGLLVLVRILGLVACHIDVAQVSSELRPGFSDFSRREMSRTWRSSMLYMAFPLGNALYFQGITLLVGQVLGSAAVVMFNTSRTLTRTIVQAGAIIKFSILPEFSFLYGAKDFTRLRKLNELAFEATVLLAAGLGAVILFWGPRLMGIWTHRAIATDRVLLAVFLCGAVFNSLWGACSALLVGVSRHGRLALFYIGAVFLSLVAAKVLAPWAGLIGVGWAMLLCEAMILPYAIYCACELVRQPITEFLLNVLLLRQARTFALRRVAAFQTGRSEFQ